MLEGEDKNLEKRMQRELVAAKEAGGDVDRLVMKRLLAGVRDSGPNTAYKALASIEVIWPLLCVLSCCVSCVLRVLCLVFVYRRYTANSHGETDSFIVSTLLSPSPCLSLCPLSMTVWMFFSLPLSLSHPPSLS